jgi:hypothetical protein
MIDQNAIVPLALFLLPLTRGVIRAKEEQRQEQTGETRRQKLARMRKRRGRMGLKRLRMVMEARRG